MYNVADVPYFKGRSSAMTAELSPQRIEQYIQLDSKVHTTFYQAIPGAPHLASLPARSSDQLQETVCTTKETVLRKPICVCCPNQHIDLSSKRTWVGTLSGFCKSGEGCMVAHTSPGTRQTTCLASCWSGVCRC